MNTRPSNIAKGAENLKQTPAHLYRYRSLKGDAAQYVATTIRMSTLYFAPPLSFNDPFDCRAPYDFTANRQEVERYFARAGQRQLPGASRKTRRGIVKERLNAYRRDPDIKQFVMERHRERVTEEVGMLCLTSKRNDILMWSHYADGHSGICLEFDTKHEFFGRALPVRYLERRPAINPFRQSYEEMLDAAILTKAQHWEYEDEWRIIEYNSGPGIYGYPPAALTGIILGTRISDSQALEIENLIKQERPPVKLYRAKSDDQLYAVGITQIYG